MGGQTCLYAFVYKRARVNMCAGQCVHLYILMSTTYALSACSCLQLRGVRMYGKIAYDCTFVTHYQPSTHPTHLHPIV